MGISGGGLVAAFASALDERIKAAVVSGYVNTFEASIMAIRHCIDNYVPGLLQDAEMPDIVGLIAPRPLLIESGRTTGFFRSGRRGRPSPPFPAFTLCWAKTTSWATTYSKDITKYRGSWRTTGSKNGFEAVAHRTLIQRRLTSE